MDTPTWNKPLTIVKVGGAVVEDEAQLRQLLTDFIAIKGAKILVHGGGRRATTIAGKLGIETKMVEGRRITDAEMLEVVTMVYGGLVNKHIVASLQAMGADAIGLTGADANVIQAHRRPLKNGIDYGWVGDVDRADGDRLASLLRDGITPVIAPLTHDGQGNMLNTNADTMAQTIACALVPHFTVSLRFAFEKQGVMGNPDDPTTFIPHITEELFAQLRADGTISGGMLPKLENALQALHQGVAEVRIGQTVITR